MDAQNAAESDQTKSPAGASPRQQSPDDKPPRGIAAVKADSPSKEAKSRRNSGEGTADRDSDAETIVLPGKDGHSPSKARKVRQEDKSDGDGDTFKSRTGSDLAASSRRGGIGSDKEDQAGGRSADAGPVKNRRRLSTHDREKDKATSRNKDGSSGLSSAPTSPPQQKHRHSHRRRSVNSRSSLSDYEPPHEKNTSTKTTLRDKLKSGERLLPHKRKAPKTDSDDEEDSRKARRQRTTSASLEGARHSKDLKSGGLKTQHDSRTRSISPPARMHRRSVSSQLPSQSSNGAAPKKKRLPPPLQSTDYRSDESSASNSPHPRNTKLRSLATPATAESNTSPLKMASHKKHLDAHGQTLLARACARGEYDSAKHRLGDRPEDLNVADYAGNTPLQIAAINGCEDIVKLLIDAGCNLDCVNYDKETPLLDAVDNGHLGVVKLLLEAGVNPRKANVNGEEPLDRVNDETENADEIRDALLEARKRTGVRTKTSEDRHSHIDSHEARGSTAPDSPRHSPAIPMSAQSLGRRGGTVRSTKTRNDLLYMPLDDKTLRQAAGRGDEETVARILQVKDGCDDAESMVAAARGGHDLVIQLLLGLGGASPDPKPVASQPEEFATPILAAIGQENIKVLELLIEQQSFDPTKRFKGETYYEIAKRRQGTNWKEEEQILKNAYDAYKNNHKGKTKSPGRREREREREEKRARREDKDEARPSKRAQSSPSRDPESRKKHPTSKVSSPKEKKKKRSDTMETQVDDNAQKRSLSKTKRDDRLSINVSDREASPAISQKTAKTTRAESDLAAGSSEGEAVKPRRKLVSKAELRGERERQRRPSMASNASMPSSPRDTKHDEPGERSKLSEKYHDRAKALKRGEPKEGPSSSADGTPKRHRTSLTPDRSAGGNKDDSEIPVKRRRLEGDAPEKRQKRPPSTDRHIKPSKSAAKNQGDDDRDVPRKESNRASGSETSVRIKSEDIDVDMPDAEQRKESRQSNESPQQDQDDLKESEAKAQLARDEVKREEERKRIEEEARKKKRDEEEATLQKRKQEEEDQRKREEAEAAKKKQEEEAAELRRRDEEKKRLAEETARRELEEKARKEAEEKRLEEERKKKEEEEARRRREEEERIRKEQEAAEEARRLREEEERKERERRERAHREELERKRAAREAEQRRIREEQERARLDKLPPLLRWLDRCPNPKNAAYAEKFKHLQGVRYDTIRPEANHTPEGREQWVLNTHAALLLGEKDLDLSRC
jgi:hypothetical protein